MLTPAQRMNWDGYFQSVAIQKRSMKNYFSKAKASSMYLRKMIPLTIAFCFLQMFNPTAQM